MSQPSAERPSAPDAVDGAVLSRSTSTALRRVLNAFREGWLLEDRMGAVARMAADDARQRGLAAERMIVALKGDWAQLEEARRLSPLDARDLLSRLIALSIRAYYAPNDHASPPPSGKGHGRRQSAA